MAPLRPAKVDPDLVRIAKAASLVEHNGAAYAHHLCLIFADDPEFQQTARRWGEEEVQHGVALARWAAIADPAFDFAAAFARFQEGFRVDFDSDRSRRGSRSGEMVARCVVEIGTSSYYSALRDAAEEPVLREICGRIAADELRHYRLFYKNLDRYLARERLGRWGRLRVALGRVAEFGRRRTGLRLLRRQRGRPAVRPERYSRAYAKRAFALYRPQHVERGVAMLLKAIGLTPNGRLGLLLEPARLARHALPRHPPGQDRGVSSIGTAGLRPHAGGTPALPNATYAILCPEYGCAARAVRRIRRRHGVLTRLPVGGAAAEPGAVAAAGWAFPLVGAASARCRAVAFFVAGLCGLPTPRRCSRSRRARDDRRLSRGWARRHGRRVRRRPDREHKLAIMRDSRHGTFGILALVLSVGLRAAALAASAIRSMSAWR